MRAHCRFDTHPARHVSEQHGYLCDACWQYSDAALVKQHKPLTFRNLLGYIEPRIKPSDNREADMSIDLDAIRARCEAATEGPWTYDDYRPRFITTGAPIAVDEADWGPEGHTAMALRTMEDPRAWKYDDVRFVAHARQDIPDLLAEVERLRGRNEVLQASHANFEDQLKALADKDLDRYLMYTYTRALVYGEMSGELRGIGGNE